MGKVLKKIDYPVVLKSETKFYHEVKKNIRQISWIRIENISLPGTPDLLGYNNNGTFFTVELKVTKGNKVRLSPHQIAFHVRHPHNTFILVKTLNPDAQNFMWIKSQGACRLWLGA